MIGFPIDDRPAGGLFAGGRVQVIGGAVQRKPSVLTLPLGIDVVAVNPLGTHGQGIAAVKVVIILVDFFPAL